MNAGSFDVGAAWAELGTTKRSPATIAATAPTAPTTRPTTGPVTRPLMRATWCVPLYMGCLSGERSPELSQTLLASTPLRHLGDGQGRGRAVARAPPRRP